MIFLFSYIIGPLIGGFLASLILKLTVNISNDVEPDKDVNVSDETYEIGKSQSAINEGEEGDDLAFDSGERRKSRGDNRGMTIMFSQGSAGHKASYARKQTGLERMSARDYMS